MTPESFLSLSNPIVYSFLLLLIVLSVVYIFYRYIIIPMKHNYLKEQEDLQSKQNKLMAMFAELDPDPVIRFDSQGKILLVNEAVSELVDTANITGKYLFEFLPSFKEINFADCVKNGSKSSISVQLNNRYYQFIIHGIPELEIGQLYGRDITELKNFEENLKQALKKAEESEKLKSDFLTQISHEIRTPLNSIIGYSGLLREELKQNYKIEMDALTLGLENGSKRLYKTIDKILNMAQIHTGNFEKYFENFNLYELLKSLHYENISFAEEKNLAFNLINKTGENNLYVYGDSYSVNQIFSNLIENALKYTHKGSVEIVIEINKDNSINVKINDTGIGMNEEYLKKVFAPFLQEESGYSRTYDGIGLGLALTKKYADLNNIELKIESEKSIGTKFVVIFKGIN
jgi:signal transduction histidine kinase